MALNTPVAEKKPEATLVKAPKDKAEAPSAPAPKEPATAPAPITQATLDSLNYDELLLEAEQRADTPDAQEDILPWIQLRLAMHYGHEKSKAALEAQADSALELLKSATSEAPPSATKLASALGTLVAAKRTSSINSNLHRQNALKMSGIEGARYAYVAGLALPPGKKHSQRLLELLDHALKEHPVFPDALLTKAEHLFKRNRIGAATKALETFSDQNHPDEALLRMAALLLPRKLYATLSPIAETVNLDALGERVHPSLVKTSKEIKRYQDVLNGNFLPLIEETRSAINESQDALQSVLQLARLQNAANDPFMANQTLLEYRTELAGKNHGRLTYEMIQVQLQARAPDIEAAKEKLVQFKLDANRDSEAWVSIANGDYALHKNQYKTALRYYKEAQQVKGDLPILSLKLNLTKAKSSQRPPDLARLTKLAKSSGLTEVNLAIARGQEATGNFEEAKSLYEIILWTDPLVISPLTLVTEFAWLVHQQGDSERAIAIATALHLEHPTFVPLIKTLIKMEASEEQSAKWTTVLNTLQPENPNDTIQMAKTWLDLDDPEKARTVIMRLLDEKPQARTAKLTRQLAR
ncbi:MAG: hypothetical protein VX699_01515, partial [Myxococcota bacterium]|nr:hypothetical protein [Myxococcota bacterium]